jgi:hypothetical protein
VSGDVFLFRIVMDSYSKSRRWNSWTRSVLMLPRQRDAPSSRNPPALLRLGFHVRRLIPSGGVQPECYTQITSTTAHPSEYDAPINKTSNPSRVPP